MKSITSTLFVLLIAAGCQQGPAPVDPSVITSRSAAWEEALNAGDVDALAELYAADARLMPPNAEAMTGREAVRASFGPMIDAGLSADLESIETRVIGDIGYNVGVYTLSSGDDVVDTGKYLETWALGDDGIWRYTNDIWNSDRPAVTEPQPEPMTHVMILHEVEDGDHWLDAWRGEDGRRMMFKANGAAHVHTFRSEDNPDLTGLVVAVTDMDALNAMLASEEGAAAAEADGVDLDNMTMLIETE
jgi:uncharacterized protein (TIGR02246 family)